MAFNYIPHIVTTVVGSAIGLGGAYWARPVAPPPSYMEMVRSALFGVEQTDVWSRLRGLGELLSGPTESTWRDIVTARRVCGAGLCLGGLYVFYNYKLRANYEGYIMQLRESAVANLPAQPAQGSGVVLESLREGSQEMPKIRPKVQAVVGRVNGGVFELHGSAVRINEYLVVPAHVVSSALDDERKIFVKGLQGVLSIGVEDFIQLDTDLMAVKLTEVQFSRIGIAICNICESIPERGEWVDIVGVLDKGTVGKLTHDATCFGKAMYYGTTAAGYSGAPYMKGNQVVGIHCWGGRVNGGYSASFVKMLLNSLESRLYEDSADFVRNVKKSGRVKRSDVKHIHGYDEVQIRYNGQYHRVTREAWFAATGADMDFPVGWDDGDSVVPESLMNQGESRNLGNPGASSSSGQPGNAQSSADTALIRRFKGLTKKQQRDLLKLVNSSSDQSKVTSGLLSQEKRN